MIDLAKFYKFYKFRNFINGVRSNLELSCRCLLLWGQNKRENLPEVDFQWIVPASERQSRDIKDIMQAVEKSV